MGGGGAAHRHLLCKHAHIPRAHTLNILRGGDGKWRSHMNACMRAVAKKQRADHNCAGDNGLFY